MELALPFKGSSIDYSTLTATAENVRQGKVFIGADGNEQTGNAPEIAKQTVSLEANGTFEISAGIHDEATTVSQTLETFAAQTVTPGASAITVSAAGKYGTGDITVLAVENLVPEYIKKGAVVGGVTGTFSDYIST